MSASFGVHIGHTSACLAVQREGRCDVVANDAGDRVTSTIVGWNGGEVLVGAAAKQLSSRLPNSVVTGNKAAFYPDSGNGSTKLISTDGGELFYQIEREDGKTVKVQPAQVLKEIYKYMHDIAFSHATADVDEHNTVVTVPLEFDQNKRHEIAKAAEEAGFKVVQVISEPASACLAYNLGQLDPLENYKCLVYRCGGQTLTVTVIQIMSGMVQIIKSLTKRDIGGNNVTEFLCGYLADEFCRKNRVDPRETKRGKQKLKTNAENVKHILSTLDTANCYIESLYEGIDFNANVTRARFDNELAKILPDLINPIQELLDLANLKPEDIEKVVLCGGTSKIPRLQKSIFGLFPSAEYLTNLNPDEVIAIGAANQASLLDEKLDFGEFMEKGSSCIKLPAISQSLVYTVNDSDTVSILIPSGCPVPVRRSEHLQLSGDTQTCIVKISLKNSEAQLTGIAQLSLDKLTSDSRLSLSAHMHRDGSIHIALTDKTSGTMDQITLQAA